MSDNVDPNAVEQEIAQANGSQNQTMEDQARIFESEEDTHTSNENEAFNPNNSFDDECMFIKRATVCLRYAYVDLKLTSESIALRNENPSQVVVDAELNELEHT